MGSSKEQTAAILTELIKDAEYRRDRVKDNDNFREVRMDWLRRAYPRIEEVEVLRILPTGSFGSFNHPDITGSLSEYYDDVAAASATREMFDKDIKCLKEALMLLRD